jgi:thiamine-phosphate pyrophosphorylase
MSEPAARLYLITPVLEDAAAFAPLLEEACAAGDVAAVLVRLAAADERTLVNRVKALAPAVQDAGAALVVTAPGDVDLATLAARGGADGVHANADPELVRSLRERTKGERAIGTSGGRSKDDAMSLGEAGADYLLFGEPRADGSLPSLDAVAERAAWWAEIFETPCAAYAPTLDSVPQLVATNAEFIALGDAVWNHPSGPAAAIRMLEGKLAQPGAAR